MEIVPAIVIFAAGIVVGFLLHFASSRLIQVERRQMQAQLDKLNGLLANDRLRGKWGETVARDILDKAGFVEGIHYTQQSTVAESDGSSIRPDYTFLLPNGLKVHMDVKFPFANFEPYFTDLSLSDGERKNLRTKFDKDVKVQIGQACKYINTETIGCVLMFIPIEALFHFISESEAIQEYAFTQGVVICSPYSLLLILELLRRANEVINLEKTWVDVRTGLINLAEKVEEYANEMKHIERQMTEARETIHNFRLQQAPELIESAAHLRELIGNKRV